MNPKRYTMFIYEGDTQAHTIDSDFPFLSINIGDEVAYGPTLTSYGIVERVKHWVGPIAGNEDFICHQIHIHCLG